MSWVKQRQVDTRKSINKFFILKDSIKDSVEIPWIRFVIFSGESQDSKYERQRQVDDHSWCRLHFGIPLLRCRHLKWNLSLLSFPPLTTRSIQMTFPDVDVNTAKLTSLMRGISQPISKVTFPLGES